MLIIFADACTLGFSYVEATGKPTVVSHVLIGGPAFKSKRVHKGDYIMLVDGAEVAGESMTEALKGSNKPGSKVRLTIKKKDSGKIEIVELVRTLTATIADKRRLFDLFCEIENAIKRLCGESLAAKTGKDIDHVTEAIELWGKMELEQVLQDERSANNISSMKTECGGWLDEIHRCVNALSSFRACRPSFVRVLECVDTHMYACVRGYTGCWGRILTPLSLTSPSRRRCTGLLKTATSKPTSAATLPLLSMAKLPRLLCAILTPGI
jgi:hypothetical protein